MLTKIIGIGNALVDALVSVDESFLEKHHLRKGSMQLIDKDRLEELMNEINTVNMQYASGGSGANTIHGLSKLGLDTLFIGKVGKDSFGNFFENDLLFNHIHPYLLKSNQTETGRALTFITPDSERTFATYLGAAVELDENDVEYQFFEGCFLLHLEGYLLYNHRLILKSAEMAKKAGLKISIDLASFNVVEDNRDFLIDLIENYVDIVFANEAEARALTLKEPEEALNHIAQLTDIAVVKLGSQGSMIKHNDTIIKVDAFKANAIDTTGAGDLYASGFLYGYANKWALEKCGKLGSLTASKVVEVIGAKINENEWKNINLLKTTLA